MDELMEGAGLGWVPVPVARSRSRRFFWYQVPAPSFGRDPGLEKRRPKEDRKQTDKEDGFTMASLQGGEVARRMVIRDNGEGLMRHDNDRQPALYSSRMMSVVAHLRSCFDFFGFPLVSSVV